MRYEDKLHQKIPLFYLIIICGMILLMIYLGINQNSIIFQKEEEDGSQLLEDVRYEEVEDPEAPAGITKEYIIDPLPVGQGDNCFAFYLVHHYAQVYREGERIYSLDPRNDSFVTKNVGCNWVMIPVSEKDRGKQIRVVVTPVYKDVAGRNVDFYLGSRYAISAARIRGDLVDILLSALDRSRICIYHCFCFFMDPEKKQKQFIVSGNILMFCRAVEDYRYSVRTPVFSV